RVLVIEDNEDSARLLVRILQNSGQYDVQIAYNGEEGLDMLQERRPDLIITDLMMPRVDGFAVIDAVKSNPEYNQIPVIVLTAKELSANEKQRLTGQIDSLLHKGSFLNEELLQSLVDAL